ncbi:MAG: MarR family EPS-associated transcriptional regulator [Deltaproteobacteria bacterium]|nr:MarR family EPS-associated transcriptional regulator [Deltaproteobacteria bacterium]
MDPSLNTFKVLDALDRKQITTQRQLAHHSGISLGQAHYVLKRLLEKGWVTLGNFKKPPRKIGYTYLLTPSGMEAKSTLAVKFMVSKLQEYQRLRKNLAERLDRFEKKITQRVVFVGPYIICGVLKSVVQEKNMKFSFVASCPSLEALGRFSPSVFDMAILGNGNPEDLEKTRKKKKGKHRIVHLW